MMQQNTPSYQVRLQEHGLEVGRSNHAASRPAHPTVSDATIGGAISTRRTFQARDSLTYILRRVTPADAEQLAEFLRHLSGQTRWLRYMTARPCTPDFVRSEVARMLAGATGNMITLVVTEARGSRALVAVAELACDHASGTGEVGVVVIDEAQRKGIGSTMLRQVSQIAQELGLAHLHGDMFAENYAIRGLIRSLQLPYTATIHAGEMHMIVQVPA